jgi:Na+/H+ antiporter NhaD/arsenite permease-like protein
MVIGAVLMLIFQSISVSEALSAINIDVLIFLFGMFCIVGALEISGFLEYAALKLLKRSKNAEKLLLFTILFVTITSAFLVNDTIVLLATPLIISACRTIKIKPLPFLLAVAFSANVGSALTPIGNPQNVLIKIVSGINFLWFIGQMIIPVILSTLAQFYLLKAVFKREMKVLIEPEKLPAIVPEKAIRNNDLMKRALAVMTFTVIGFFISDYIAFKLSYFALLGGCVILLIGNNRISILKKVDWKILVFFCGMFVLMKGFAESGVIDDIVSWINPFMFSNNSFISTGFICLISLGLSQLVSNVPFVALMVPIFASTEATSAQWLSLAAGSTLAGNATLIGAAANIIVLEAAESRGETFSFIEFTMVGIIFSLISIALFVLIAPLTIFILG